MFAFRKTPLECEHTQATDPDTPILDLRLYFCGFRCIYNDVKQEFDLLRAGQPMNATGKRIPNGITARSVKKTPQDTTPSRIIFSLSNYYISRRQEYNGSNLINLLWSGGTRLIFRYIN